MTSQTPPLHLGVRHLLVPLFAILTATVCSAQTADKPADEPKKDDVVHLSPFTVTSSKDSGYFAENTLAGSRMKTNLGDLAASITIVTKQQLDDTGSRDINDVFRYEAGTEGSNTYTPVITDRSTAKDAIGGYTLGNNGNTTTNAQANRIRGIGTPDSSINYYPTSNRIPFDSYNTDSIEISRGPNALLFGLGAPSGIVNQSTAKADLDRDSNQVQARTDNHGSFRTSLNINRVLIQDKLAIYGAFLYDNEQFQRKPSRDLNRREYGAFTYKPFKNTVIRAFAENYQEDANRPNSLTPRDFVTPWLQGGRPAYDPTTRMITNLDGGQTYGPYVANSNSPGYVTGNLVGASVPSSYFLTTNPPNTKVNPQFLTNIQFEDTGRPLREIDNGNSVLFFNREPLVAGVSYASVQSNPAQVLQSFTAAGWLANDPRFLLYDRQWSSSNVALPLKLVNNITYGMVNGVPYGNYQIPGVTNKAIYDWTKYNDIQTNFAQYRTSNYNIEIEQQITPDLFFSAGWFRQDINSAENYTEGQLTGNTIQIDTNTKRIDGTTNPYFGLPFISEGVGGGMDTFYTPQTDDNFRVMLAYNLDFTRENSFVKWLGRHRLLAFGSRQTSIRAIERWRNGFVDGDPDAKLRFVPNLNLAGQQLALNGLTLMRKYYLASPGDPQATVTHSSGFWGNQGWNAPFASQVQVYNYTTGAFQNDTVVEQALFSAAGSFRTQRQVNSLTLAAQSNWLEDRLVTTLGWRYDKYRARITSTGALTDVNGVTYAPAMTNAQAYTNGFTGLINRDAVMNRWWRWDELSGATKTYGGAFRPFKDWDFVQHLGGGSDSIASEFVNGFTLYSNKSANFNPPATFQTDYFKKPLGKPTGQGQDLGVGFNLFKNKLVVRLNWYHQSTTNERTDAAGTLLGRLAYSDTTTGLAWASAVQRIRNGANTVLTNWNTDAANNVSDPVNQQKIYDLIHLPFNYYAGLPVGGTQNSKANGMELQLTYNPLPNWTIKVTGDRQRTSYDVIAPQYDDWLAVRLPVWQTQNVAPEIADFTDGGGVKYSLKNFWTGYGFTNVALITDATGNTSPSAYFNNVVASQVALAKALQGADQSEQRRYHAGILTNYIFTKGKLKGFSFGGSQRYESKSLIGYYGKVNDPVNAPGVINFADITRPIYDKANYFTDVWLGYQRKVFNDKIGLKVQLNVYSVFEGGHLQPTAVNFDGTPWSFRIIDPRQFVLTTTFTF
jgi:hypothetical protein